MTIPESVIETVVEESVLVTESELSVSVSGSEPIQNLLLSAYDQPSSPSHIQILEQLISVKKELNRLYNLGTLITWFASYSIKSSQILKNHSIMLFTSNTNLLCRKMQAWTSKKQGNLKKCKG